MSDDFASFKLAVLEAFNIEVLQLTKMEGYGSLNFKVSTREGENYLFKYYPNHEEYDLVLAESQLIEQTNVSLLELPSNIRDVNGNLLYTYQDGSFGRLLPFLEGELLGKVALNKKMIYSFGEQAALLNLAQSELNNYVVRSRVESWDMSHAHLSEPLLHCIQSARDRKLPQYFLDRFKYWVKPNEILFPKQIIHGDLNEQNVFVKEGMVCGLIDFGDLSYGPRIYEVAIALCYIMMLSEEPLELAQSFLRGYHQIYPLTEREVSFLSILIPTRLSVSVCHSAQAKMEATDTEYILISEKPAWALLHKWIEWNPVHLDQIFLEAIGVEREHENKLEKLSKRRSTDFMDSMSLSYQEPIHMTHAAFQYMYDAQGNTYLDAYNNIIHIGHSHPRMSEVLSDQVRVLNTNTRYHYNALTDYSEKLLEKFPPELNKLFLLNSGSEANELAIRIAKTVSGREKMLIRDQGYHGVTKQTIELSAYKFNGKGGTGQNDDVFVLPLAVEGERNLSGEELANEAIVLLNEKIKEGFKPAALLLEIISGCGGQAVLATGYLKVLSPFLKRNGIYLIADEVQTGFGRTGIHFWAFENQEVVPDFVVIGKPMGNGFPIAGVVTKSTIVDEFDQGMEFFSSFGGNPLACKAGEVVLDVLEDEKLEEQAREVGEYFVKKLNELKGDFQVIEEIRGSGLFLGIVFRTMENEPNGNLALIIKEELKSRFILTGIDGKYNHVLKIKPPMCFSEANVDRFVKTLKEILKEEK